MDVLIAGGGMIVHDQILPSLYHLQRTGVIGDIRICASSQRHLSEAETLRQAFPGQSFRMYPGRDSFPEALAQLAPHQLIVVALPDQLHYDAILAALRH